MKYILYFYVIKEMVFIKTAITFVLFQHLEEADIVNAMFTFVLFLKLIFKI